MELVRKIVRVGNSAGVVLPREWLNGTAKVELVRKPLDIKGDILKILEPYLEDISGIYLVGSYARGEETENSDVDVLVITDKIGKNIESGKYSIVLVPKDVVESTLKNNALPILPRIKEAKALINNELIGKYKRTELTKRNLKWYLEVTKSAMKVNEAFMNFARVQGKNSKLTDGIAYSLILNLRSVYIIDCIKKEKMWSNKVLLEIIKKLYGNLNIYEGYLRSKNNLREREDIELGGAERVYYYILKKIAEHEKWLRAKGKSKSL